VFSLSTDGSGFTTLHSFPANTLGFFNNGGIAPYCTLVLSGNTLYGTAKLGGAYGFGTVFSVSTFGTDFKTLYNLGHGTIGAWSLAGLVLSGNELYGTTSFGGSANVGTVFSFSVSSSASTPPPNTAVLSVQYTGRGSASPNDNGKSLRIGKTFQLTAVPGHDWLFSNWVASGSESFVSNNPVLKFTMESNLVLQANFITNLFLPVLGKYSGLFAPATPRQQADSGSFSFNITSSGAVSGNLDLGGQTVPFSGKFDIAGVADITSKPVHGIPELTITLQLDFSGQSVSGTVSDDAFSATLIGYRNVFSSSQQATAFAGRYTLVIPGTDDPTAGPFGTSYGTVKVSDSGVVTLAGSLADGTTISQSSVVSQDGYWPLYVSLYGGKGSLWGSNLFTNHTLTTTSGLSWINETNSSKTAVYHSGFTNQAATLTGGIYESNQMLPSDLTATLAETNPPFSITVTDLSDNTNKLTLKTNKTTGVISGSFANPDQPQKTIKIHGVILQGQTNVQGYFLGTNQSGVFTLDPQ
jgi:uncharacterized repeat protein (TIGR03803 family)